MASTSVTLARSAGLALVAAEAEGNLRAAATDAEHRYDAFLGRWHALADRGGEGDVAVAVGGHHRGAELGGRELDRLLIH